MNADGGVWEGPNFTTYSQIYYNNNNNNNKSCDNENKIT